LNQLARSQMTALLSNKSVKGLKTLEEKANLSKLIAERENTENKK